MRVTRLWTAAGEGPRGVSGPPLTALAHVMVVGNNAVSDGETPSRDPTELALLEAASGLGERLDPEERARRRRRHFHFDPARKLMSTLDERDGGVWIDTKGAPEAVLPRCPRILGDDGVSRPLDRTRREALLRQVNGYASEGLRVLAFGVRELDPRHPLPEDREQVETELTFVGLAAMLDPPRAEVAGAVRQCHAAGIRIIVVTGDHPLTSAAVAREVGIATQPELVLTGEQLDGMSDAELDARIRQGGELIFARMSPEAKLRIAESLRAEGHVVAMTGDGVNDAPALRRADIGIGMGRSGTDVAREAATMVLTDDDFATIVAAVEAGRRVYDRFRKFIVHVFAHATPGVVPFLVFALGGGAIPLPLTVLQLLVFDVGTETLPALALGREPAERGLMQRPPRPRREGVIQPGMLVRSWLFLGLIATALQMGAFFFVLRGAGWIRERPPGPASRSTTPTSRRRR